MALTIINSPHSFIRFNDPASPAYCGWGSVEYCLPAFDDEDAYFQFIIDGEVEEIDNLCTPDAAEIEVGIITGECLDTPVLVFSQKPVRFRLSDTQILYNWEHGIPGFKSVIDVNKCFKIQVHIIEPYLNYYFCSNCFERVADDCFTSVIEYGNDEDSFGFKYCNGGEVEGGGDGSCDPVVVQFINQATLSIPYTALLQSKFGPMPTVQAWLYDNMGQLVNMGIQIAFYGYPVQFINLDFGGAGTGIVIIR